MLAADVLHLMPSAVSQQIARLEAVVGVTGLDRQPRGAVLTQAGRVLAETAERIESELTDARKALAALHGDVTGTLGAAPGAAAHSATEQARRGLKATPPAYSYYDYDTNV
ncbi:LysR family transcriptional regulator [Streptomyces javensis]|uniref:LysR family transcriptional regulator n=1 Tax=Streptomyces javensis TaxID=114698 RepID=UPI0033C7BE05